MHVAEIVNGMVKRVIVADSRQWCIDNLGGEWVEQGEKNAPAIGHTYDGIKDVFIAPKPFNSAILNEKMQWEAPVKPKSDDVTWDEKNQRWLKMTDVANFTK